MTIYRGVGGGGNATSDSEINAVTALSVEAEDSATLAGVSANASSVSAGSAATSASAASSSASAASASAATATTQATNASTSAAGGATSASNAAASEAAALASENAAAASEAAASTAATTATTQASGAVVSASTATTQATNATSFASAASTSETNAATSETNAASSASAASSSASSASASADAALTALDNFDDRYLGQKASDPTVDNDGNALIAGALYFNTTDSVMKVYDGSIWVAAYASLSGALLKVSNLSDVASVTDSRTNLGLGTAATTASTDYATAAQGALADSALQAADVGTAAAQDVGYFATAAQGALADSAVQPNDTVSFATLNVAVNTTTDAVRITQTGTGNAFVVEDSTSPDSTPFVINAAGNVGIGTSSPDAILHVAGVSILSSNSIGPGSIELNQKGTGNRSSLIDFHSSGLPSTLDYSARIIRTSGVDGSLEVSNIGTGVTRFVSNGAETLRVTGAGNVGIGNTSPTQKLDVTGTVKATAFTGDGSGLTGVTSAGKAAVLSMVFG